MLELILGGARSGKSQFAQQRALTLSAGQGLPVTYVATATVIDEEMHVRIGRHQQDRPSHWQTDEVPLHLVDYLHKRASQPPGILLIDCLTLWLNNQLYHYPQQDYATLFADLIRAFSACPCHILAVANEVGLGVIPTGKVNRQFVDQAGWLNQAIAKAADRVLFVAAGLPQLLKGQVV